MMERKGLFWDPDPWSIIALQELCTPSIATSRLPISVTYRNKIRNQWTKLQVWERKWGSASIMFICGSSSWASLYCRNVFVTSSWLRCRTQLELLLFQSSSNTAASRYLVRWLTGHTGSVTRLRSCEDTCQQMCCVQKAALTRETLPPFTHVHFQSCID